MRSKEIVWRDGIPGQLTRDGYFRSLDLEDLGPREIAALVPPPRRKAPRLRPRTHLRLAYERPSADPAPPRKPARRLRKRPGLRLVVNNTSRRGGYKRLQPRRHRQTNNEPPEAA
jgi:hypothetical protein